MRKRCIYNGRFRATRILSADFFTTYKPLMSFFNSALKIRVALNVQRCKNICYIINITDNTKCDLKELNE